MPNLSCVALCSIALALASPASAVEFLSRADLEQQMETNLFCYHPTPRLSCAWAELYTEQKGDVAVLYSASAVWDMPMEVIEFQMDWRDDALCVAAVNQGIISAEQAPGYRFPFDRAGLEPVSPARFTAIIAEFADNAPVDFCFRYSVDPERDGWLRQHVFRDGAPDAETDPIALIPRFAGAVAVEPR